MGLNEDYLKAVKRLFRRLYKEEEYVGRTHSVISLHPLPVEAIL
jgi:hypothetical protein